MMATKEFNYKGKNLTELQKMDMKEFIQLLPARQRRSLARGLTDQQKKLLSKIKKHKDSKKQIKTHIRDMIVLPEMVGSKLVIHAGRDWVPIEILNDMIGHYLGEFTMNRKKVAHSAPGIGATRSSAAIAQK
ncbi:MAG: 30S ribosomal protein S19 [Nanoarchaeota archaeon]